jgi:hypothetical protein
MRLLSRRAERHRHQQVGHLASHARWHRDAGPERRSGWRTRGHRTGGPGPNPPGHPLTDHEGESPLAVAAALEHRAPQALVPGGGAIGPGVVGR